MSKREEIRRVAFRLEKRLGEANPISRYLEILADLQVRKGWDRE